MSLGGRGQGAEGRGPGVESGRGEVRTGQPAAQAKRGAVPCSPPLTPLPARAAAGFGWDSARWTLPMKQSAPMCSVAVGFLCHTARKQKRPDPSRSLAGWPRKSPITPYSTIETLGGGLLRKQTSAGDELTGLKTPRGSEPRPLGGARRAAHRKISTPKNSRKKN